MQKRAQAKTQAQTGLGRDGAGATLLSAAVLVGALLCPVGGVALARPAQAPAPAPVWRQDLGVDFGKAVCAGEVGGKPFALWAAKAYDAQVEGRIVASRRGQPVGLDALAGRARTLASLRSLSGYSYGLCDGGQRGWIAVMPAPQPMQFGSEQMLLPLSEIERQCSSYRVDFAARKADVQGGLKQLTNHAGVVSMRGLGDGVLSVTCQPRAPRWQGPVLWYLAPVGQGPEAVPPEAESFASVEAAGAPRAASAAALVPWLQRLRAQQGLGPLAPSEPLNEAAANLAADGSLVHNRQLLESTARAVEAKDLAFLGEDRVRARDVASMAWLLWNSPRHRQLLLNKDANAIGLAARAIDDDQLTVVVLGKGKAMTTSQAAPAAKAGATSAK